MHFDRACRSVDQGTDYANRGRLTGAVGPEQRKEVTFVDGQVYTIERNKIIVIGFFKPADFQCFHLYVLQTAGVDIEIRRAMWSFLEDINNDGTTIILTTHYLEEAETLCRNVAIIDDGRIIEQGEVGELLSRSQFQSFVFDLQQAPDKPPQLQGFKVTRCEGTRLDVEMPLGDSLNELFEQLGSQGIQVISMRNKTNRLEEFFLRLVSGNDQQEGD